MDEEVAVSAEAQQGSTFELYLPASSTTQAVAV